MNGSHVFGGGFMWIFWIILIFVVVWGIKGFTTAQNNTLIQKQSALDIIKERYARGEINEQEFEKMKSNLE